MDTITSTTPVLTWNLFVQLVFIPVCFFLFAKWWKWQEKKRDADNIKISKLEEVNTKLRDDIVDEWRSAFVKALNSLEEKVGVLINVVPTLITKGACDDSHDIIKDILDDHRNVLDSHGNRITTLETEVKHLQNCKGGE